MSTKKFLRIGKIALQNKKIEEMLQNGEIVKKITTDGCAQCIFKNSCAVSKHNICMSKFNNGVSIYYSYNH